MSTRRPPIKRTLRVPSATKDVVAFNRAGDVSAGEVEESETSEHRSGTTNDVEAVRAALKESLDLEAGNDYQVGSNPFFDHLRQAIANAELSPKIQVPDLDEWRSSLRQLVQQGVLDEQEEISLLRTFGDIVDFLNSKEGQRISKFSERISEMGIDDALAWYRKQAEEDQDMAGQSLHSNDFSLNNEFTSKKVVSERARRLRGPPGR